MERSHWGAPTDRLDTARKWLSLLRTEEARLSVELLYVHNVYPVLMHYAKINCAQIVISSQMA